MKIAGIVKSSLIDYPGKASTVIFTGGCNFRCGYCHNPDLVINDFQSGNIIPGDFFDFLLKRKRFIDAVCITGGEPTLHSDLTDFIKDIKSFGMSVKLDTNGTDPSMLRSLLDQDLLNYVALDIKGPFNKYEEIARCKADINLIRESAAALAEYADRNRCFDYEFRTTVCRELLSEADLRMMIDQFPRRSKWYLQTFRNPGKILDQKGCYSPYTNAEMKRMGDNLCVSVR